MRKTSTQKPRPNITTQDHPITPPPPNPSPTTLARQLRFPAVHEQCGEVLDGLVGQCPVAEDPAEDLVLLLAVFERGENDMLEDLLQAFLVSRRALDVAVSPDELGQVAAFLRGDLVLSR